MDSWILCPCQRSRLDKLKRMLSSLDHPVDRTVLVVTHPDPITEADFDGSIYPRIVHAFPHERFISQWWNVGLDYIQKVAQKRHEVMAISSDMIGMSYSVAVMGAFLRRHNLTMAGPNLWTEEERLFGFNDPRGATHRVPGCCWMLAGETRLRLDESFRWWYSDDDLEMQARFLGWVGIVPGTDLVGEPDTPLSAEKQEWALEDRQKFVNKWGREPW